MPESRNLDNGQRLFSVKDLPSSVLIEDAHKDREGNVHVLFQPENHSSVFSQKWLRENCYELNSHFEDRSEKQKKLWQKDSFDNGLPFIRSGSEKIAMNSTVISRIGAKSKKNYGKKIALIMDFLLSAMNPCVLMILPRF